MTTPPSSPSSPSSPTCRYRLHPGHVCQRRDRRPLTFLDLLDGVECAAETFQRACELIDDSPWDAA